MRMADRTRRHSLIAEVLATGPAPSQDALVGALASLGVQTTQATLSRDLRDLGVIKTPAGYMLPQAVPAAPLPIESDGTARSALESALRSHLLGISAGVGLVVCKTAPGHAQVIALELDRTPPHGVIGTVAGDDTIFIAVDERRRASRLAEELAKLAGLESTISLNGSPGRSAKP